MLVAALDDDAALDRLAPEWRALHDAAPSATPFQSWEWARAWWSHRRRGRLCVLTARDDAGALVGLLPLVADTFGPTRRLTFLGAPEADYQDLLAAPAHADAACAAFAGWLAGAARGWDVIDLPDVREGSALATLAPPSPSLAARRYFHRLCPYLPLDAADRSPASAGKKLRAQHRPQVAQARARLRRRLRSRRRRRSAARARRPLLAPRPSLAPSRPARRLRPTVGAPLPPRARRALLRSRLAAPPSPAHRRQDARRLLLLRRRCPRLLLPLGLRSRLRPLQPRRRAHGARRRRRANRPARASSISCAATKTTSDSGARATAAPCASWSPSGAAYARGSPSPPSPSSAPPPPPAATCAIASGVTVI